MQACFDGWRRKAGCVTLVIACLIMGMGYARSSNQFLRRDVILFEHNGSRYVIVAKKETIVVVKHAGPESLITWQWRGGNLGFAQDDVIYPIPYWSVALPLAVLSGYLIVWEPPKRQRAPEAANSTVSV